VLVADLQAPEGREEGVAPHRKEWRRRSRTSGFDEC